VGTQKDARKKQQATTSKAFVSQLFFKFKLVHYAAHMHMYQSLFPSPSVILSRSITTPFSVGCFPSPQP